MNRWPGGVKMDNFWKYLKVDELLTSLVAFAPHLVVAFAIMLVFWIIYRIASRPLRIALAHTELHEKLIDLLVGSVFRYTMIAFGLVMSLSQLGVDVGAAVAGLGVAGIAVGLAAQDTLSNTIAGFTIFWDKPFVVGDYVTVAGEYGRVTDVTLRSTRIRTPRNSFVVIPNKNIIDQVVKNDSKHGELRLDLPIGIAYKEDTYAARDALLAAVAEIEGIMKVPEPDVVVESCGSSSVDLKLRIWIEDAASRWPVFYSCMESAKRALDAAGIQIPFPHLQLFWDDVDQRVIDKLGNFLPRKPAAGSNLATN
jgi:small conductance mechanosensitive channel